MEKITNSKEENEQGVITFHGFAELLSYINRLTENPYHIYRGYNNDDEIYPSIIHSRDLAEFEEAFLREFEKYGLSYFSANNAMEFLSTAQHYGLPTRLLDFTYNPFVALFFSLYYVKAECDDPYYKVIFCDERDCYKYGEINAPKGSFAEDLKKGSYTDELIELFSGFGDTDKLCIVNPAMNNQRIMMQQGLFLIPTTLDKAKHKKLLEANTTKILIHKSIRKEALGYLDVLGFNAFRLMPDLASVCHAVKHRVIAKGRN